jgi:tetratricopeptide (TPR) repeat protein
MRLPNMQEKTVSLLKRTAAAAIDQIICLSAGLFMAAPPALVLNYLFCQAPTNLTLALPPWLKYTVALLCILCAIAGTRFWSLLYCIRFESSDWQATPGKLLMGLTVTDIQGNQISRKSAVKRISVQYLTFCLLTALGFVGYQLTSANFGSNVLLEIFLPLIPLFACFLAALFNEKGQTVFDFLAQRLVEDQNWSFSATATKPKLKAGAREATKIILKNSRGRYDWFLLGCSVWSLVSAMASAAIFILVINAFSELDQIPLHSTSQSATENNNNSSADENLAGNEHYRAASRYFRDPGLLYYYRAELAGDSHFGKTDNLRRAAMLSDKDWQIHNALANIYLAQNQPQQAANELERSCRLRSQNKYLLKQGPLYIEVEPQAGHGEQLNLDQQYLKLGKLYNSLGRHKEAIAALDKAISTNPNATKYKARAAVYEALGEKARAQSDLMAAHEQNLRVETELGTIVIGK